ncbi:MAG: glycosyltransferase [Bryobacterales bacterium]
MFGIPRPAAIPTGVDADYFNPQPTEARWDLIFVGSMDWLANIDAATFFVEQVLPVIRRSLPSVTVALVGRRPAPAVRELARQHPGVTVTGTVADIRPYLWASKVSIVPLRIGGGTRLKIYEAMAAECPVVSTTIGAEGLDARSPDEIRIGDTPDELARHCVELLRSAVAREAQAQAAAALVRERFSWDRVATAFTNRRPGLLRLLRKLDAVDVDLDLPRALEAKIELDRCHAPHVERALVAYRPLCVARERDAESLEQARIEGSRRRKP